MPYEDDYKMWLEKMLIESNPDWVCDGMYDMGFTHEWCEKYCGEDSEYVTPKCLHMYYHHIVKSDRKTEPQKKEVEWVYNKRERLWYPYSNGELLFKDEPTTQMKTQNSNLTFEKADERCKGCNHYKLTCDLFSEICRYEPKDKPQTERSDT